MGNLFGKLDRFVASAIMSFAICLLAFAVSGQSDEMFPVPEDYITEGIPPIKKSEVSSLFFDQTAIRSNLIWDADTKNRKLLVTDQTNGIYLLDSPMSKPVLLLDKVIPLSVKMNPNGDSFGFLSDYEDEDNYQLYRYDFKSKRQSKVTVKGSGDESVNSFLWSKSGKLVFYVRVNYDAKTSQLCSHDFARENCVGPVSSGNWDVLFSDSHRVLLKFWKSSSNQQLFVFDTKTRKLTLVEDKGNNRRAFIADERIFWSSEGNPKCSTEPCVLSQNLKSGQIRPLDLPAEISSIQEFKISPSGKTILIQETREGIDYLHILALKKDRVILRKPSIIPPSYVVWHTRWLGRDELAYTIEHIGKPASVHSFDFRTGRATDWTREKMPKDLADKVDLPQVVKWSSFDGREISGYSVRPKNRTRKSPVLIFVHGGPQVLDRPIFNPQELALVSALGITVIHTNIRGSSGFGREFMDADDEQKRGDAVKDIRALLDWVGQQPDLDSGRVFLRGQSYGGFIVLAAALAEPEKVSGVIAEYPLVSIRGLLSMSWIDESAILEYGDPKNENLMKELDALSPLNNADRWNKTPLFLTRGRLDERNPERNTVDLKNQLKEQGADVWFVYSNQAGHGFSSDFVTAAIYQFVRNNLDKKEKKK